jgi:hypothetical protein
MILRGGVFSISKRGELTQNRALEWVRSASDCFGSEPRTPKPGIFLSLYWQYRYVACFASWRAVCSADPALEFDCQIGLIF